MNKILIYTAAFTLVTAALISASYATTKIDNSRVPNVDNNVEFPSSGWRIVKHTFRVHIPLDKNPLDQILIDVPSTVAVSNDINVLNENSQKININVSAHGRRIIIDFPEKIISNTKLLIELNKVRQPVQGSASVYNISAKVVGSDKEIPVGVAQFPTF
ncbi:DUF2808 domain-containing protein [Scytonema sp. PRP1]|uniref:DUF2808 domain-containing protein n=1 Tax=Scytonema sp. PRP1 TaxID=3120513 RepID=UPI00300C47DC